MDSPGARKGQKLRIDDMSTEDLKNEVCRLRQEKEDGEIRLEKIGFLLSEVLEDYGMDEAIEPGLAAAYMAGRNKSDQARRHARICFEYGSITMKLSIASDYIFDSVGTAASAKSGEGM